MVEVMGEAALVDQTTEPKEAGIVQEDQTGTIFSQKARIIRILLLS